MILNTVALAITLYILRVLLFLLLRLYLFVASDILRFKNKKLTSIEKTQRKQLFFGDLHLIYVEGFIEIMITIKLSLTYGTS